MSLKEIKGKFNTIEMVDPEQSYFIVEYADGHIVRGKNLIDTGWKELKDGIRKLSYRLSNGLVIEIPPFEAYLQLIEVSQSIQTNDIVYHSINVKGLKGKDVVNYNISLKQGACLKRKIGDVDITIEQPTDRYRYWKKAASKEIKCQ